MSFSIYFLSTQVCSVSFQQSGLCFQGCLADPEFRWSPVVWPERQASAVVGSHTLCLDQVPKSVQSFSRDSNLLK